MSGVIGRPCEGLVQRLPIGVIQCVPGVNGCQVHNGALGKVRWLVEHEPSIPHKGPKR